MSATLEGTPAGGQRGTDRSGLRRWGETAARRYRLVLGVWLVMLLAAGLSYPYLQHHLEAPNYGVDGAQSTTAARFVQRYFPDRGTERDVIVFHSDRWRAVSGPYRKTVVRVLSAARAAQGVRGLVSPFAGSGQISRDGHTAIAFVGLTGGSAARASHARDLQKIVGGLAGRDVHAWLTGYSPVANDLTNVEDADATRAESIGIPIAFVVLLLALGAVAAALMPLALAAAGLVLTFGVIAALTLAVRFDAFIVTVVTMIGTGIGIDYSLFIVSRFREELARTPPGSGRERERVVAAVGKALATSGRTVITSGAIVMISLCSLFVVNAPVFREISIGVLVVVSCTLAGALTLLPALLSLLGTRVNRGSLPARLLPPDTRPPGKAAEGGWARWAHTVMRHPILAGGMAAGVLVLAAIPIGSIRYGIDLGISSLSGTPSGQAEQILARSFSPGLLSPVELTVTGPGGTRLSTAGLAAAQRLTAAVAHDRRVAGIATEQHDGRVLIEAAPSVAIDSTAATQLVEHIRGALSSRFARPAGIEVAVGGATAEFVDLSHETRTKLPIVLALVLAMSLALLLVVFRSAILPLKAIAMNLLATGAAIGITVAVFQNGHGATVLGFTSTGFLQVYLPITVFALLFGLSMDYEVFLIRRMQETWNETADNTTAVATGIEHTARPITAAALIMAAVFGSFVTANVLELKEFGLALATAVTLDALLVRLVLVPALMRLLGHWNWWLPAPISRRIPTLNLE